MIFRCMRRRVFSKDGNHENVGDEFSVHQTSDIMIRKPKVLNGIIVICHHGKSCGFLCDRHRVNRKM